MVLAIGTVDLAVPRELAHQLRERFPLAEGRPIDRKPLEHLGRVVGTGVELLPALPQLDVPQLLIAIGRGLWQRMQLLPQYLELNLLCALGRDKILQIRGRDLCCRSTRFGRSDGRDPMQPVQLLVGSPGRRKGEGIELFQRLDRFLAG